MAALSDSSDRCKVLTTILCVRVWVQVFKEIELRLPPLRRRLSLDLDEASRAEVVDTLRTFTAMCHLPEAVSEPHPQNQKILYNFG